MAKERLSRDAERHFCLPGYPLVVQRHLLLPSPIDDTPPPFPLPERPPNWPPLGWHSNREPIDDSVDATLEWLESVQTYFRELHYLNVVSDAPEASKYSTDVDDAHLLKQHFQRAHGWRDAPPHPNLGTMVALRAADELQKIGEWIERNCRDAIPTGETLDGAAKAKFSPAKGEGLQALKPHRPKRSTEKGEGRHKLIAALNKHHQYADGSCLNRDPVGNNKLARLAEVSYSTASTFFRKEFQGHSKYKVACCDSTSLVAYLKLLNQEFSPHHLYGGIPPGEGKCDEDE